MNEKTDIYGIIIRSFTDTVTQSEKALLETWKAESRANLLEYLDYETLWKESGKLASTRPIDIARGYHKVKQTAGLKKQVRIPVWVNVAAVIVLSLLFTGLYTLFTKPVSNESVTAAVLQEIQAPYGTKSSMKLPDGTTVHLNSGSSMTYPVSFGKQAERRVVLSGEGFFDVKKQYGKPFIVDVCRFQVEVTGTRFNVDAYPGNQNITVALAEGEVNITRTSETGSNRLATLTPGEVARYSIADNHLYIKPTTDLEKYYAWTEGKIVFIDDPIQAVAEKLSNWYNVDIEIADRKLDRYRFTGTFINEPVEQILSLLSRTSPMRYTIIPSRKLEDQSYTRRKIILKSK